MSMMKWLTSLFFAQPEPAKIPFTLRCGSRVDPVGFAADSGRVLAEPAQGFLMAAFGTGGPGRSEVASRLAIDIIPPAVVKFVAANRQIGWAFQEAFLQAHKAIVSDRNNGFMGASVACVLWRGNKVHVANLGDCRVHLIRRGEVTQLTVDHTLGQYLVAQGKMTPEEARFQITDGPGINNTLLKYLGCTDKIDRNEIVPFLAEPFTPENGDYLLLGCDGLTNVLDDHDLRTGPRQFADPQTLADHLVATSLQRNAKHATCLVVRFDPRTENPDKT